MIKDNHYMIQQNKQLVGYNSCDLLFPDTRIKLARVTFQMLKNKFCQESWLIQKQIWLIIIDYGIGRKVEWKPIEDN